MRRSTAAAGPLAFGPPFGPGRFSRWSGYPLLKLPDHGASIEVDGLPFSSGWTGDSFDPSAIPFHACENCFPSGEPPPPSETVEVAIIGGGLSGLATAYALRDRSIALLELRDRMGGVSMGERWNQVECSLGSAYFIVPDEGSELETLYRELGVWPGARVAPGELTAEIDGAVVGDLLEWTGFTEDERAIVHKYAALVRHFATEAYPEIPLPPGEKAQPVLDLDHNSLKLDLEARLGGPLPARLAAAIQAYCYSSFGAGWQSVSAAAGWNFVAAEEFGRIVLPGGNAGLAAALWRAIAAGEQGRPRPALRPAHRAVDVRLDGDHVLVTRRRGDHFESIRARHAVLANSKFIGKYMIHELETLDAEKRDAMDQVATHAYVVVNVLLRSPADRRFYDLFLLDGKEFPMDELAAESEVRVMDVIDAGFGDEPTPGHSILTLYWPLPWPTGRASLIVDESWFVYAKKLVPQLRKILRLLDIDPGSVEQVRMSRWAHSMPIATTGAMVEGICERLRRPIADRIWFVNQDNWLLPAVETCLLEALHFAAKIRERL